MTVGQRIKSRRKELGLSQSELGKKLGGISKAAISATELDKRDITTERIRKYAEALDCTPAYLMGWEVEEAPLHENLLNSYYQKFTRKYISEKEEKLLESYRAASDEVKDIIDKILGTKNES